MRCSKAFRGVFRGGSIISNVLEGNPVEKGSLPASVRYLIQDDVLEIEKRIQETNISWRKDQFEERCRCFGIRGGARETPLDRTFRLALGVKPGEDYDYITDADGQHISFYARGVAKLKKMSKKKWTSFEGYWEE